MAETRPHRPLRMVLVIATAALTFLISFGGTSNDDVLMSQTAAPMVFIDDWPGGLPNVERPPERVTAIAELPAPVQIASLQPGREHVGLDVGVRRWRGWR